MRRQNKAQWSQVSLLVFCILATSAGLTANASDSDVEQQNKAAARGFYEDLWFSNNTRRYEEYFDRTYVVHDIGEDKALTEPAATQKEIADFWWDHGTMSGEINYQIADGDLVATRWEWQFKPTTFLGRILKGRDNLPIINVFRFEDGKIVEVWNHRHDIDTGMPLRFKLEGFGYGVLLALIPLLWALLLRRRLKRTHGG